MSRFGYPDMGGYRVSGWSWWPTSRITIPLWCGI